MFRRLREVASGVLYISAILVQDQLNSWFMPPNERSTQAESDDEIEVLRARVQVLENEIADLKNYTDVLEKSVAEAEDALEAAVREHEWRQ